MVLTMSWYRLRLGKYVAAPLSSGPDRNLLAAGLRDHDHGEVSVLAPHRFDQRQTVHHRHIQVGQDKVGQCAPDRLERFQSMRTKIHFESCFLQQHSNFSGLGGAVLSHQDARHGSLDLDWKKIREPERPQIDEKIAQTRQDKQGSPAPPLDPPGPSGASHSDDSFS